MSDGDGGLFRFGSLKSLIAGAIIFGLGVLLGREWMKAELREALGGLFSGRAASASAPPPKPWVPPTFEKRGPPRSSGNSCTVTLEVKTAGTGGWAKLFAVDAAGQVIDSTSLRPPVVGQIIEPMFIYTACDKIADVKIQPAN